MGAHLGNELSAPSVSTEVITSARTSRSSRLSIMSHIDLLPSNGGTPTHFKIDLT